MGKCFCAFLFSVWSAIACAQSGSVAIVPVSSKDTSLNKPAQLVSREAKPTELPIGSDVLKPIIGLGAGSLSFYGEINTRSFIQNPSVGRIGYDFSLSQKINSFLQFNFYALYGKLGVAEDQDAPVRNANFQSTIFLGGINLQYNFDQFLPKKRIAEPFILTGIEGFNFNSKTDLYDQNGSLYYYWSDGSIKNMPQNSTNAANAVNLVRSYNYSTDLRQADLYGFGKYPLSSGAIPLGIGVNFHLSERVDLNFYTTMHFTFTDYIDGLGGVKDKFMMTGFSLHWDLLGPKRPVDTLDVHWYDAVDFAALDGTDSDGDGVRDTADKCPGTPPGAIVDIHGCPTDRDGDGVPDYLDKEPDSKPGAIVDQFGVALSDSLIRKHYLEFYDTTNQYAEVITKFHGPYEQGDSAHAVHQHAPPPPNGVADKAMPTEYSVLIGNFKSGLPAATMSKFLSIRDVETTALPDSSIAYTVGHYSSYADAQSRKRSAVKDGLNDAKIVYKKDGKFIEATSDVLASSNPKDKNQNKDKTEKGDKSANRTKTDKSRVKYNPADIDRDDSILVATTKGVVFRIQLGAYRRKISKTIFGGVPDLIEVRTEDGLHKYMTGSYSGFSDAAKSKLELVLKGYEGAFITAYKNGKRVPLSSVGATPSSGKKSDLKEDVNETDKPVNVISKQSVVFKVQVGVYKGMPPAEKQALYKSLNEPVGQEYTSSGLTRFIVGNTNDYNEALKIKNRMNQKGIDDAFIIAYFNGQYITIQEALEITK